MAWYSALSTRVSSPVATFTTQSARSESVKAILRPSGDQRRVCRYPFAKWVIIRGSPRPRASSTQIWYSPLRSER